jgi:hypothetical protein
MRYLQHFSEVSFHITLDWDQIICKVLTQIYLFHEYKSHLKIAFLSLAYYFWKKYCYFEIKFRAISFVNGCHWLCNYFTPLNHLHNSLIEVNQYTALGKGKKD